MSYPGIQISRSGSACFLPKNSALLTREDTGNNTFFCEAGFPPRGTGGDQGPPQYFSQKNPDFYRGLGGTMVPPKKNGVLEVVDDPPWSCDPTVQSIWLAVPEVEEKGVVQSF